MATIGRPAPWITGYSITRPLGCVGGTAIVRLRPTGRERRVFRTHCAALKVAVSTFKTVSRSFRNIADWAASRTGQRQARTAGAIHRRREADHLWYRRSTLRTP
jgi:hypothetical protein